MINYDEKLKETVKSVIKYSQEIDQVNIDDIFSLWAANKEEFYANFGNQYIKDLGEVKMNLPEEVKEQRFYDFLRLYDDAVFSEDYNALFVDYLRTQKDGFYSNKVVVPYYLNNGIKIIPGMKLIKTFKYFISDPTKLDNAQTRASMLVQSCKVNGNLCLSIHPLDYLTVSENNFNWRSCHSLDGEFRSGNLSYMGDKTTFVAYIRSKENTQLDQFPNGLLWNNKKWRVLIFTSESRNYLMAGRQYPMNLGEEPLNIIKNAYATCFSPNGERPSHMWSSWHDDTIDEIKYKNGIDNTATRGTEIPIRGRYYVISDIVKNGEDALQFNDLLYSTCYTPYYCWFKYAHTKPKFEVGVKCNCVRCGKNLILSGEDSMLCPDCLDEIGWS